MQNGGFVNKIQGVRLSVAKIHRHVFENPGYMMSEEFSNLARLRNGVETVPSNLWKNYYLDTLPRGKQRGNFSLEVK